MSGEKCQFKKIFWCTVDVVFWSSLSTSIFQFSQFSVSVYLNPVPWKLCLMHYLLLTLCSLSPPLFPSLPLFPPPPLLWKSSALVVLSCPLNARRQRRRCARNAAGHSCFNHKNILKQTKKQTKTNKRRWQRIIILKVISSKLSPTAWCIYMYLIHRRRYREQRKR